MCGGGRANNDSVEILLDIIEGDANPYPDPKYCGYDAGAGIKIAHKISDGVIKTAFALHEPDARRYLKAMWVKRWWTVQVSRFVCLLLLLCVVCFLAG